MDGIVAAAWYANPEIQALTKMWKYQLVRETEKSFCRIVDIWVNRSAGHFPNGVWTIVPTALHPRKARERGFDQSVVLSEILSSALKYPVGNRILARKRYQRRPQAEINDVKERAARDFSDVFAVNRPIPRDIILVDDVYTTGTTMNAAAKILKEAGAERVWGFALLRGH
ncbi:MAG: phosphoribosyltransferase family protein [Patescibacteria group bacterium]